MTDRSVTLRDDRDKLGSRHLVASLSADGTLTIEGQDLGRGVEQAFGSGGYEYEWAWTIRSEDIPQLIEALDAGEDVLAALATRISGDAFIGLGSFLEENGIPHEFWSRVGD